MMEICFALVEAQQHGITVHNHSLMRKRESWVISFITYHCGGVGRGLSSTVSIVYFIRKGEELCLGYPI